MKNPNITPLRQRRSHWHHQALTALTLAALTTLGHAQSTAQTTAPRKNPADIEAEIELLKQTLQKAERELAEARQGPRLTPAVFAAATPAAAPAAAAVVAANTATTATAATAATAASGGAAELGSVVVSGTKSLAPIAALKDVPRSVSAVGGVELERLGVTSFGDVLKRVNNINFNYGNPRTGSLTLRGLTTGSADVIDPSVGLVIDGVSLGYSPIANGAVYLDIDSVEVTHGPQGTLGYKGSSTGQVEVKNRKPSFVSEAEGTLTFGELNTVKGTAVVGGPVVDGLLAWRGTLLREQADGWAKNAFPDLQGRSSYPNTDKTYARLQFLLTPTDHLSARLSIENQPRGGEYINGLTIKQPSLKAYADGTAFSATTINAQTENRLNRGWFRQYPGFTAADYLANPVWLDNNGSIVTGSRAGTLDVEYKSGDFSLRSITGTRDHWFSAANDEGTPFDITKSGGFITYYRQLTQELRAGYSLPNLVDLSTGVYFSASRNDSQSRTRYGSDAGAWFATGDGTAGNGQYGVLANPLAANSALVGAGNLLLRDTLNGVYKVLYVYANNKSAAWYGSADWHLDKDLTLTTGARVSDEGRKTTQWNLLVDQGFGRALSPVNVNNVQLGGFAANAAGVLDASNSATQLALADSVATRYFGVATTAVAGAAYNSLSAAQKAQVAAARAVRAGQTTGLYLPAAAEPYKGTIKTGNLSLADKLTPDTTVYATLQYGEKAGISQINGTTVAGGGISVLVKPEKTLAYEIGARTSLLNKTLMLNGDLFLSDIKDFQQTVSYLDPVLTQLNGVPTYGSGPGNVKAVRVKGVEFDAQYTGVEHLNLRLAGAWNDARYRDHKFAGLAQELNPALFSTSFRDVSGQALANAPKFTANLSADYRLPVLGNKVLHSSVNYRYTSSYNSDANLSAYSIVPAYGLLDLGLGFGRQDGGFDVNVIAKNAANQSYHVSGPISYTPSVPRWIGVVFSGKL